MNTTLEKLRHEASIMNEIVKNNRSLEHNIRVINNLYIIPAPFIIFGALAFPFSLEIKELAFLLPIAITIFIIGLAILVPIISRIASYNGKLQAIKTSDVYINIEANREYFWTELGLMLDKNYGVLIPIAARKNGNKFKSPAEAENMDLLQEVDGVQCIINLRNLVPYIVGEEVIKLTPSN